jgi:hypothetical protein
MLTLLTLIRQLWFCFLSFSFSPCRWRLGCDVVACQSVSLDVALALARCPISSSRRGVLPQFFSISLSPCQGFLTR